MNVVITLDHHYFRTPDGTVWTHGVHAYPLWKRYLSVFDGVKVVARVRDVAQPQANWSAAVGTGVAISGLPDYRGPWQYLTKSVSVREAIRKAVDPRDAVIMRVSSHIAGCLEPFLARRGQPYGVEVINDPFDLFAPKALDYRLRPLFRWEFRRQLRRQCERAGAAAYVTDRALQSRYPCPRFTAGVSDVEIPPEALRAEPRFFPRGNDSGLEFRLITVGTLEQMCKAPDVLIQATAQCASAGLNVTLRVAGDGKHRNELERLAARLGIAGRVHFLGELPAGASVRDALDSSDVFVLPSRSEGLPRALVEAMARSLPCVASAVGGIPELLAAEDLVPPADPPSLARKLIEVLRDPNRLNSMSVRNRRRAADFQEDRLATRRNEFFREVRRITNRYLTASPCGQRPRRADAARSPLW